MAEFCLACWNKLNKRNEPAERYVLSKDLDLCEGFGEWKNVIVRERKSVLWKSGVQAVQILTEVAEEKILCHKSANDKKGPPFWAARVGCGGYIAYWLV